MASLIPYAFPQRVDDAMLVHDLGLTSAFQLEGINFKAPQSLAIAYGIEAQKFILSLDKGAGKTITYLSVLHFAGVKKFLILCSNNSKLTQKVHLDKFFPHLRYVFVEGQDKAKRKRLWHSDADVFIATAATFLSDMGKHAKSTGAIIPQRVYDLPKICDECHKYLRTRKSGVFSLLKEVENPWLILSSGSAGGKGPQDLWAMLHLCDRKMFRGFWPYVNKYTYVEESRFGKVISGVRNVEEWRREVGHHCFHRRKDLKDYPPKTRQAMPVEMPSWQKKIHDQLRDELWAIWKDEGGDERMIITPNTLQATMRLRQFLVCPKILDASLGWGAGLEAIAADVEESELPHFVISTPFRAGIPLIQEYLLTRKIPSTPFMGGLYPTAVDLQRAIASWTKSGGAAIQTIKYAESYELPAARIMYMLGYEHSADQNSQAEDRIHRDIRVTPHPVDIYYTKHLHSYEQKLIDMMAEGADVQHAMMHKPLVEIFE